MEMYGYTFACESDLAHHGIKGMHWGIRRYQNADGSLTAAGRERYFGKGSGANHAGDVEGAKKHLATTKLQERAAQGEYNRKTAGGMIYNEEAAKKLIKAKNETIFAKEDVQDEKVKDKLSKEGKVSARREKLIDEYKKKGMTDEEAEVAAYKRERTERMLKVAGAVAVTAAVAYGAAKYKEYNFDQLIDAGTSLSRVASSDSASVRDGFYAVFSKNKMDTKKYAGLYANQLQNNPFNPASNIYQKTLSTTQQMKLASTKSAANTLAEMAKDSGFKQELMLEIKKARLGSMGAQRAALDKALTKLQAGKVDASVYKAFNITLADQKAKTTQKFYQAMKDKGYDALMDFNDKSYSGYMTKMPVIVLNSGKVSVDKVIKLGQDTINKNNMAAYGDILVKTIAPQAALYGGGALAVKAASSAATSKKRDQIVADYRKEHPNTNLSYNDIVRNYYRNQ